MSVIDNDFRSLAKGSLVPTRFVIGMCGLSQFCFRAEISTFKPASNISGDFNAEIFFDLCLR